MIGWGVTVVVGLVLGVTSYWHSMAGGWWPLVALAVVMLAAGIAAAIAATGKS